MHVDDWLNLKWFPRLLFRSSLPSIMVASLGVDMWERIWASWLPRVLSKSKTQGQFSMTAIGCLQRFYGQRSWLQYGPYQAEAEVHLDQKATGLRSQDVGEGGYLTSKSWNPPCARSWLIINFYILVFIECITHIFHLTNLAVYPRNDPSEYDTGGWISKMRSK